MNEKEMGKVMVWMLGAFPQWKPDAGVAKVWAGELPNLSADFAIALVRQLQARKPSPFPPSIFELLAELRLDGGNGRSSWQRVLDKFRGKGWELTDREKQAVKLLGGWDRIGQSKENDPFLEKSFLEIYNNLTEEYNVEQVKLGISSRPALQLDKPRTEMSDDRDNLSITARK